MKVIAGTKKIPTRDLRIGMFVVDVGRGWLTHPWPTKSKMITQQSDIDQLLAHNILEVLIDPARQQSAPDSNIELGITESITREALKLKPTEILKVVPKAPCVQDVERRRASRPEKPVDSTSIEEELPKARQAYEKALDVTREFVRNVRAGRNIEVNKVQESVEDMIDSVFRSRGAMSALLKLKNYDEYTFTHSLNVTALAVTVGRHVNLDRQSLSTLGLGAMFHDVGKFLVPSEILNKPGKLTDDEFVIMKTHAYLGAMFLGEKNPGLSPEALSIVRHHHERLDGSGYPDALHGDEIDLFSTVCGMCDVYDALSSDRVYHKGMPPHEALKIVFSLRGKHFPSAWTDRFVQSIGIYPPGTAVKLSTGHAAVVVQVNHASLVNPRVIVVIDAKGRRLPIEKDLDLADPKYEKVEIKQVLDPVKLGIDTARYFPGA